MRLSEVLSNKPTLSFKQVEGFLGKTQLLTGRQRKVQVGRIAINYYCKNCLEFRTFLSREEIYCIGVNEHLISIDSVLTCHCGAKVQVWFLVDCDGSINGISPEVRVLKRSEKLSNEVLSNNELYGDYSKLLEKAHIAHREGLGAGSIIYLRKIFEQITIQSAIASGIDCLNSKGKRKSFKDLLEEVDLKCSIIPREFSMNSYRLFGELSEIIHGDYNEDSALAKYDSLNRLIVGILENIKNNNELNKAIEDLGWDLGGN